MGYRDNTLRGGNHDRIVIFDSGWTDFADVTTNARAGGSDLVIESVTDQSGALLGVELASLTEQLVILA